MPNHYNKQFKEDAVRYYQEHKDLGAKKCATNLGIGYSTLSIWIIEFKENGEKHSHVIDNYLSDEQNEIALLKSELRDKEYTIDVLIKALNML